MRAARNAARVAPRDLPGPNRCLPITWQNVPSSLWQPVQTPRPTAVRLTCGAVTTPEAAIAVSTAALVHTGLAGAVIAAAPFQVTPDGGATSASWRITVTLPDSDPEGATLANKLSAVGGLKHPITVVVPAAVRLCGGAKRQAGEAKLLIAPTFTRITRFDAAPAGKTAPTAPPPPTAAPAENADPAAQDAKSQNTESSLAAAAATLQLDASATSKKASDEPADPAAPRRSGRRASGTASGTA